MIFYNNQEYGSFKELRENCHLVSEREVTKLCHCKWKTVRKICEQNGIKRYSVIANTQECLVYDESIIDLINKNFSSFICNMEKEVATHSSTLDWNIPWTKEPGRL